MDTVGNAAGNEAGQRACVKSGDVEAMEAMTADGWQRVCALEAIPKLGARVLRSAQGPIAIFRTAEDEVFALADKCPHKGGPLSQGIVFGRKVACPLHNWNIGLDDGQAVAPDVGCAKPYAVKVEGGAVYLNLAGIA